MVRIYRGTKVGDEMMNKLKLHPRGFSLLEVTIVMGILTILLSTAFTVLITFQSTYQKTSKDLIDITERSLGERAIWLNLLNAGPSFNNINQLDDSGNNFFDLLPDHPAKLIPVAANRVRSRTLLNAGDSLAFLVFDKQAFPPVYYDAARAYNIVPAPNASVSGTMTFAGVNNANYLNNMNGRIFRPNSMVMLYTPQPIRAPGAAMITPPRFTVFTGRVVGAALNADTGGGIIRNDQPATGAVLANADQFFQNAPTNGSPNLMVYAAGVQLIRFRLQGPAGNFMLMREVWNGAAWALANPIAVGVTRVLFRRDSLSLATVTTDVNFNF